MKQKGLGAGSTNRDKTGATAKEESRKIDRRSMLGMTASVVAGAVLTYSMSGESHQTSVPAPRRRRFDGKVVVITAATSGIGRAAAVQFAAEGTKVCFCGRREKLGQVVESEIKDRGWEGVHIRADVRDESEVKAFHRPHR